MYMTFSSAAMPLKVISGQYFLIP